MAEISHASDYELTGQNAAHSLLRYESQVKPTLWQPDASQPYFSSGKNNFFEARAKVNGVIVTPVQNTLLLQIGMISITADYRLPSRPSWLDSGSELRVILELNANPSADQAAFRTVAIAPEAEVDAIQQQSSTRTQQPSRQTAYAATATPTNLAPGHPICQLSDKALAIYPYYRSAVHRFNPNLSDRMVDTITSSVLGYSDYYRVDPRLIMAMIIAESGFDPYSTSSTGAMGLGQLMPETADSLGIRNAYDPIQNIGAAVKILSDHVNEYGGADKNGIIPLNTLLLTMAAYNAGGGAVKRYHGVPPYRETQNYVRKVSSLYRAMCGG